MEIFILLLVAAPRFLSTFCQNRLRARKKKKNRKNEEEIIKRWKKEEDTLVATEAKLGNMAEGTKSQTFRMLVAVMGAAAVRPLDPPVAPFCRYSAGEKCVIYDFVEATESLKKRKGFFGAGKPCYSRNLRHLACVCATFCAQLGAKLLIVLALDFLP